MAVKTTLGDTEDGPALLDELSALRFARDWSYRELADDITRLTGYDISGQTLQPLLSVPREERAKPYDRTIHKIRQYLDAITREEKSDPAKKRRAS